MITARMDASASLTYSCYLDNQSAVDTSWTVTPSAGSSDIVIGTNRQFYKFKHRIADASAYSNGIFGITHNGYKTRLR